MTAFGFCTRFMSYFNGIKHGGFCRFDQYLANTLLCGNSQNQVLTKNLENAMICKIFQFQKITCKTCPKQTSFADIFVSIKIYCSCCNEKHSVLTVPGVAACACNPAILEDEFRNGVGSKQVGSTSPSIGG